MKNEDLKNVATLPLEGNRIWYYFINYLRVKDDEGETAATIHLHKKVPKQFHRQIVELYKQYKTAQRKR